MSDPIADRRAEIDAGIANMTYEEARSRLVEIVTRLEQGSIPLEESLDLWEIGEKLAAHCQSWLDGARERLDAVRAGDGDADAAPGARSSSGSASTAGSEVAAAASSAGTSTTDDDPEEEL